MNLIESEKRDRAIARALGIRAQQEGLGCDSLLDNPQMKELCKGRDHRGIKMLVGDFANGWSVQKELSAPTWAEKYHPMLAEGR